MKVGGVRVKIKSFKWIPLATIFLLLSGTASAMPTRVVVLPFYVENGKDVGQGGQSTRHFRRTMGFIKNQLHHSSFEVVNPFAKEYGCGSFRAQIEPL